MFAGTRWGGACFVCRDVFVSGGGGAAGRDDSDDDFRQPSTSAPGRFKLNDSDDEVRQVAEVDPGEGTSAMAFVAVEREKKKPQKKQAPKQPKVFML